MSADSGHIPKTAAGCFRARCVWFTGLPASGKSTLAGLLERRQHEAGRRVFVLDGDALRRGLNGDLGYTEADRKESMRRAAEVARLMYQAGLIVIVALISPHRAQRAYARGLFAPADFIEVFVETPLDECERRYPKGLYAKARSGRLANFTGIDSPYEPPEAPELVIRTTATPPEQAADALVRLMET